MSTDNPNTDIIAEAFADFMPKEAEQTPTAEVAEQPKEDAADALEVTEEETLEEAEEVEAKVEQVEEEKEEEIYTIKVDGEEIAVPLSELKAGYMKDADYRRKTAEVAKVRKETEADAERYKVGTETLLQQLAIADRLISEAGLNLTDEQLDTLAQDNPAEYVRMQRIMQRNQEKMTFLREQFAKAQTAQLEEIKANMSKHRKAEREALEQEAPEFRKTETWERLFGYLKGDNFKFTQEEIDSITDRRFAKLAEKARRYDALMAKGADREKQVRTVAKVIKPTAANNQSDTNNEFQRLSASVRKGDKMALGEMLNKYL